MPNHLQTAINAALCGDWQKAISTNLLLLKENKNDINTLSRLAHAYVQTGKLDEAKKLYKKIITLDKYNIIAQKNLDKLASLGKTAKGSHKLPAPSYTFFPSQFLEEPGKTKTINLKNIAPAAIISRLTPGAPVTFFSKKHSIDIRTLDKIYIGTLPDDLAFRLLRFLKAGYEYASHIKAASKNAVNIFIRETKRAKKFKSQPSFVSGPINLTRSTTHDHKNISPDLEDDNQEVLEE